MLTAFDVARRYLRWQAGGLVRPQLDRRGRQDHPARPGTRAGSGSGSPSTSSRSAEGHASPERPPGGRGAEGHRACPGNAGPDRRLNRAGNAYASQGDVYFSSLLSSLGKLSKRQLEDLRAGAPRGARRAEAGPLDSRLWSRQARGARFRHLGQPLGPGRPAGTSSARDVPEAAGRLRRARRRQGPRLSAPRERESRQSEAARGRSWRASGCTRVVNVDAEKMSKSLGTSRPSAICSRTGTARRCAPSALDAVPAPDQLQRVRHRRVGPAGRVFYESLARATLIWRRRSSRQLRRPEPLSSTSRPSGRR